MKTNMQHNKQWSDNELIKSLPELELPYTRSKEVVWSELSGMINAPLTHKPEQRGRLKTLNIFYLAAAFLVVMLATTAFLRLYTRTVYAGAGQHQIAMLPDGSSIELNASSTIKYHPYWWWFNRQVQFEGEGFFKVSKGKSFQVESSKGKTIVLGTSFNIFARKDNYKVTCYTGKVRVISTESGQSADIAPCQQAIVKRGGNVVSQSIKDIDQTISWMDNMFIFTGTPLQQVFEEVERQYGITIHTKEKLSYNYTGNFTRKQQAEEVMHNICVALGLKYKKENGTYLVNK